MKKLQEIEMKRQQAAILKEQVRDEEAAGGHTYPFNFQEKERRRQHMLLVKQFDTRKRNEERRKKLEELRLEREKEKERRMETRRMELEILSEMKRPVEDMAVPDPRFDPISLVVSWVERTFPIGSCWGKGLRLYCTQLA